MAFRRLIYYHLAESPRFQKFAVWAILKIEERVVKNKTSLERNLEKIVKSDRIDPEVKRFCDRKTKEMEVTPDLVTQVKKKMAKLMKGAHGTSKWL